MSVDPAPYSDSDPERQAGELPYLDVLARIHALLQPRRYLEIGVRRGRSLTLARCAAVGVDPEPAISVALGAATKVVRASSDAFFTELPFGPWPQAPDLVFIDGMHLFEYALRDFMNVERIAAPTTLVIIDDVFPNHPLQARRARQTRVWTGDVWKLPKALAQSRPDLLLFPVDTKPTGLMLVTGLDASHRLLWKQYDDLVACYCHDTMSPPKSVLQRQAAFSPSGGELERMITELKRLRDEPNCTPNRVNDRLRIEISPRRA
jgi:hypothetical protein